MCSYTNVGLKGLIFVLTQTDGKVSGLFFFTYESRKWIVSLKYPEKFEDVHSRGQKAQKSEKATVILTTV